jgi:hypothetical protein
MRPKRIPVKKKKQRQKYVMGNEPHWKGNHDVGGLTCTNLTGSIINENRTHLRYSLFKVNEPN